MGNIPSKSSSVKARNDTKAMVKALGSRRTLTTKKLGFSSIGFIASVLPTTAKAKVAMDSACSPWLVAGAPPLGRGASLATAIAKYIDGLTRLEKGLARALAKGAAFGARQQQRHSSVP